MEPRAEVLIADLRPTPEQMEAYDDFLHLLWGAINRHLDCVSYYSLPEWGQQRCDLTLVPNNDTVEQSADNRLVDGSRDRIGISVIAPLEIASGSPVDNWAAVDISKYQIGLPGQPDILGSYLLYRIHSQGIITVQTVEDYHGQYADMPQTAFPPRLADADKLSSLIASIQEAEPTYRPSLEELISDFNAGEVVDDASLGSIFTCLLEKFYRGEILTDDIEHFWELLSQGTIIDISDSEGHRLNSVKLGESIKTHGQAEIGGWHISEIWGRIITLTKEKARWQKTSLKTAEVQTLDKIGQERVIESFPLKFNEDGTPQFKLTITLPLSHPIILRNTEERVRRTRAELAEIEKEHII